MKSLLSALLVATSLFTAHGRDLCSESDYLIVRSADFFSDGFDSTATVVPRSQEFPKLCRSLRKSISTEFLCGFHWRFDFATHGETRYSQWINVECEDPKILGSIKHYFPDSSANNFLCTIHFAKDQDKVGFASALLRDSIYPFGIEKNLHENINALVIQYTTELAHRTWASRVSADRSHRKLARRMLDSLRSTFPGAIIDAHDQGGSYSSKDSSSMNWDLVLRSPSLDSARILQSLKTISSQITVKEWALVQPSEQTIYVASRMRDLEQTEAEIRRAYPFVSKVEWFRGERTIERIDDVLPTEVDSAMMQNIQRIRGTDHQGQPYGLN